MSGIIKKFAAVALLVSSTLATTAVTSSFAADLAEPSQPADPGLFGQKYLFGNWGGARDTLASHGIILDVELTQFYQGLLSGTGSKKGQYGGKVDYKGFFVGDLVGVKGFAVAVHAETRYGDDLNIGTSQLLPPNAGMLLPSPLKTSTELTGFLVTQRFTDDGWTLVAGKFQGLDLMDMALHTGGGINKFMNTGMVIPTGFFRTTPLSFLGGGLLKMKGQEVEGALLVYDTNGCANTGSCFDDPFKDGAVVLGLWRFFYEMGGLAGNSAIFGNYSTKNYTSIDPVDWVPNPGEGIPGVPTTSGSWMVGYAFDQVLWADATNPNRNVGLSGMFTVTDGSPSFVKWSGTVALEVNGVGSRDEDSIGVGFTYEGLSDDFVDLVGSAPIASVQLEDGYGAELYYKMQIAPWWSVTADLQVIDTNLVSDDTAVIGAVRTNIKF
jgi:porin